MKEHVIYESLVLAEETEKVEIPASYASKLVQTQRDGIRFLFKQFVKKQPGVVLNDPSGYGKRAQIILFLEAIKSIITEPVLILCQDLQRWIQEMCVWIGHIDEVSTNTTISKKYRYYATTFDNLKVHLCRKWSVIVVDYAEEDFMMNYIKVIKSLKGLKGGFIVWMSSHDIKLTKHIEILCSIYEWMDKDFKMEFEPILSKIWNTKYKIKKSILLDQVFLDIYLRRDSLQVKFLSQTVHNTVVEKPVKHHISRKNKDSTGSKIKRTKRSVNDDKQKTFTNNDEVIDQTNTQKGDQVSSQELIVKKKLPKRIITSDDEDMVSEDDEINNYNNTNEILNNCDDSLRNKNGVLVLDKKIDKNYILKDKTISNICDDKNNEQPDLSKATIDRALDSNKIGKNEVLNDIYKNEINEKPAVCKSTVKDCERNSIVKNIANKNETEYSSSNNEITVLNDSIKANIINKDYLNKINEVDNENNSLSKNNSIEFTYNISNNRTNEMLTEKLNDNKTERKNVIEIRGDIKKSCFEKHTEPNSEPAEPIEEMNELEQTVYKKYKGSLLDFL